MNATQLASRLLEPVPANALFGIRVLEAADARAQVGLTLTPELGNVIGSLHSSGLTALVDATGLAAVIAAATAESQFEDITPLGTVARLEFVAPARGTLTGRCTLDDAGVEALHALYERRTAKARLATDVEVADEHGAVVCRGAFEWKLRRRAL